MDRASGWYKRRTQSVLLLLGLIIGLGGNVNSIAVVRWLYAERCRPANHFGRRHGLPEAEPEGPSGVDAQQSQQLMDLATQVSKVDQQIADLKYPVGWTFDKKDRGESWLPEYILGSLVTAIAISMGSTFWFDALQNLIKLRFKQDPNRLRANHSI